MLCAWKKKANTTELGYSTSQNIHNLTQHVVPINSFLNVSKTFVIIENVEDIPNNASIGVTDSRSFYRTSKREYKFQESKILWLKIKTISLSYALHKVFLQLFFHKYQCSKRWGAGWVLFPFFLARFLGNGVKTNSSEKEMIIRNPWILILDLEILHWAFHWNTQVNVMIQLQKGRLPLCRSKGLPAQADLLYQLCLLWKSNYLLKAQSPDTIFVAT